MPQLMLIMWLASPHKFHASLTQMVHNPQTRTAEVVLRLFADDLENTLGRRNAKRVVLDKNDDAQEMVFTYIQEAFRLHDGDGALIPLKWVGLELDVQSVWVYLELPIGDLTGLRLENKLFFELFDDQVNTVNIKQNTKRATLIFKRGEPVKQIEW